MIGLTRALALVGVLGAYGLAAVAAEEMAAPESGANRKQVVLPGLVINLEERCVDVESSICLHEGTLELIACTKDSKEHESIVVIAAKAEHIHAALLLLGANPGNPAMRRPDVEALWIDMPPAGDPVGVFLAFADQAGKMVEHPISDFIAPADDHSDPSPSDAGAGIGEKLKFTESFLFAGSQLRSNGSGRRQYLSDLSGNVISLATFGDELLCLSGTHGQDNGALMWQINSTKLPQVGSKVTLRLRPKGKANAEADKRSPARQVPQPEAGKPSPQAD